MKGSFLARAGLGLAGVVFGALSLTGKGAGITEARADEPAAQAGGVTGPACVLKGTAPVPKGTQVFDEASGGRAIASFVGSAVPMKMTQIPADPVNGRVRLATSLGSGSVRIEGYVPTSAVTVYTTRDLSVMAGNVSITSAQKVKLVRAQADSLQVEPVVGSVFAKLRLHQQPDTNRRVLAVLAYLRSVDVPAEP